MGSSRSYYSNTCVSCDWDERSATGTQSAAEHARENPGHQVCSTRETRFWYEVPETA